MADEAPAAETTESSAPMTPAAAEERIAVLSKDGEFTKRLYFSGHEDHEAAATEWKQLHATAASAEPEAESEGVDHPQHTDETPVLRRLSAPHVRRPESGGRQHHASES